jgi:hypothetical protein
MPCCVCTATNRTNEALTFSKVPKTSIEISSRSTDEKRFQYYRETFRRKIFLQRFCIPVANHKQTYLSYCSLHKMPSELFQIAWKNSPGEKQMKSCKLVVPKDVYASALPTTRASRMMIHSPPPKRKRNDDENKGNKVPNILEKDADECSIISSSNEKVIRKRVRKCSCHKCSTKGTTNMSRLPGIPKIIPKQYYSHNFERVMRASKIILRQECMRCIGIIPGNASCEKDYRICWKHNTEHINKYVEFTDLKNRKQNMLVEMVVPVAYDAIDNNLVDPIRQRVNWRKKFEETKRLSANLANELGMDENKLTNVTMETLKSTSNNDDDTNVVTSNPKQKKMCVLLKNHNNKINGRTPRVLLSDMDDHIICQITGFPCLSAMICYVIFINRGEINQILDKKVTRTMTWFEEWLMVSERLWGRSLARWRDATLKYGVSQRQLADIFNAKIKLMKDMRSVWGLFTTYLEDKDLRMSKWEAEFALSQLVMWDNTNIPVCFMPTDAEAQRNMYSLYYGGNVGKGGVYIQPCGWMGTYELWMGSVSDTEYMLKSKAFEMQKDFIEKRDPLSANVPWLNMFDKGYRNIGGHAHQLGGQLVVQPNFARSDERFSSYQTLRSASVARMRAGNELAVKMVKNCKFITSRLKSNESAHRLCDVWLVWGYQVNYMFCPVH